MSVWSFWSIYLKQAVFLSFLYLFLSFLPFPGCLCVRGARQTLGVRVLSVHLSLPPSLPCLPCFSCCCVSFPFVLISPLFSPPPPPPYGSSCRLLSPELWCHSGGERADVGVNRSRLRSVRTAQLFPPMAACAMIKTISSCHCLPGGDSGFLVV